MRLSILFLTVKIIIYAVPVVRPANVAVGVARLGSPSAFIGRVGNDPLGQFMQDTLNAENVNTQHMILDPQHRTSTVIVGLDNGERSFTFMVNPSADQFLQASDLPPFQQGEWLHCCSIALINNPSREATFEAIRRVKAAGGFSLSTQIYVSHFGQA